MIGTAQTECQAAPLTPLQFERIAALLYRHTGIAMTPAQRTMAEVRLRRRLHTLGLDSFDEYEERLHAPGEEEVGALVDCLTTHKTDFFREPAHFDYLVRKVVPELGADGTGSRRPMRVWSAACSTGEEVYTLAIVLEEHARSQRSPFRFSILGTDISSAVLEKAVIAVYPEATVRGIPNRLVEKYFRNGRNSRKGMVRVAPEVRQSVEFARCNLADPRPKAMERWDVIFCRNVLIYFDKDTRRGAVGRLVSQLNPGGYLFLGHAEAVHDLELPLAAVAPAAYRKRP